MPKQTRKRSNPSVKQRKPEGLRLPTGRLFPLHLFAITIIGIISAEIIAMVAIYLLQPMTFIQITLVDVAIMVLLIFPVLYAFSFRPLLQHLDKRIEAEKQLAQEEDLQQRFFNSIDTLIAYMDRDFNFIQVNDAYASSDSRPPDFFPGKNHFDLYPHAENEEIFQRVLTTAEPYVVYEKPFEYPEQPERGVTYWNWNLQPVTGLDGEVEGLVLSLVDVTKRKQAEIQAELEQNNSKAILDALPDGVYIVNQQFDIEYANPVVEKIFGSLKDQKCYQYFHDSDIPCESCKFDEIVKGKEFQWEWYSLKTGRFFEVFDTPLINTDGGINKLKLLHDITYRKEAEEALESRNRELRILGRLEHKQRQLAETLRAATHALTKTLDLDTVLDTLLNHVRSLINADTAMIFQLEEKNIFKVQAFDTVSEELTTGNILSTRLDIRSNPFFQKSLSTNKSLLLADTTEEASWVIYPGIEKMRNFLIIPLRVEDKHFGFVGVGKSSANYFTDEHIRWAETLIAQAAAAIQNAWLFEQVQTGRERLQFLSRRLVDTQETERRYIARELHDQAGQILSSLKLGLGALEKYADQPQEIHARTSELKRMTDEVQEDLHRLAVNLRPASLDHLGLISAIEQFIKYIEQDSELTIKFKTVGLNENHRLSQDKETNLYRIVQEALTNVIRHAEARQVDIVLEYRSGSLLIVVEDNGKGFNPEMIKKGECLGLMGMQERTEMMSGEFNIESIPGKGTTLVVEIPYENTNFAGG